jgi:SAM-dependent methyltransferase
MTNNADISDPKAKRLAKVVQEEAMGWGNVGYHDLADANIDSDWPRLVWPLLSRHKIDFSNTIDFACGRGRNAKKLKEAGAAHVTLIDVNPENIEYCNRNILPLGGFSVLQNNGFDLRDLPDAAFTFVYSLDAMVHFDLEIVLGYIGEFARVLSPGGIAFIHHSNYTGNPGGDFHQNPDWRNFMSAEIFKHASIRNGFEILEQTITDWSGGKNTECFTVMRRGVSR